MLYPRNLCTIWSKNFSTSLILRNHYDSLGITPKATQTDVKSAYYKLSMIYHPDKNKGSEDASKKFRDITSAYEVLGNYKLRKLYDKGLLQHFPANEVTDPPSTSPDHPHAKFYRSRQHAHKPPTTGRTPIYNFDEWSRAHYTEVFQRSHRARQKFNEKMMDMARDSNDHKIEKTVMIMMTVIVLFFLITIIIENENDKVTYVEKKD